MVVLESLACGTPVVGYNVPFMWNFRTRAVKLTRIGCIEALAQKTIELIDSSSKAFREKLEATPLAIHGIGRLKLRKKRI